MASTVAVANPTECWDWWWVEREVGTGRIISAQFLWQTCDDDYRGDTAYENYESYSPGETPTGGGTGGYEDLGWPVWYGPWGYDAAGSIASGWRPMDKRHLAGSLELSKWAPGTEKLKGEFSITCKKSFSIQAGLGLESEIIKANIGTTAAWEAEHSVKYDWEQSETCDTTIRVDYHYKGMSQRFVSVEYFVSPIIWPTGKFDEKWGWLEISDETRVKITTLAHNCQ